MFIQLLTKVREAKVQQKPGENTKLYTSTLLTGAHLAHETKEVCKADPLYIEHAGEHDWQTTERWASRLDFQHIQLDLRNCKHAKLGLQLRESDT